MFSYMNMYESGKERLRDPAARNEKIEFELGGVAVRLPLKVVTFHARNVYPHMLRSTLLIRLVASFEAFLVDSVEEVSRRSNAPFLNEGRVEFSQEQLLTIDAREGIYNHLVRRTLRILTGGGLREIRKFYQNRLGVDIVALETDFPTIEELHDRRHIFVHRAGYPDADYIRKHPDVTVGKDHRISVTEKYLIDAMDTLNRSGLHVKDALETAFPTLPLRRYVTGSVELPDEPKHLQFMSLEPLLSTGSQGFDDLSLPLGNGKNLRDIVVWKSDDRKIIRLLIGGGDGDLKAFGKTLGKLLNDGQLRIVEAFTVKRRTSPRSRRAEPS